MSEGLTPRQVEIKTLADAGKTPKEIAAQLSITENAVFQQKRRIRERLGETKPKPATLPPVAQRDMTPLQAIRARRSTVERIVAEAWAAAQTAAAAAVTASELHQRVAAKNVPELKQLEVAEAALTGKPLAKAAAPRKRPSRAKKTPAPAVSPTPENASA
jgi:transcriptional regulator